MPDDILKRLRFWSDDIGALIPSAQVATVKEAADEIERLRSVVVPLRRWMAADVGSPEYTEAWLEMVRRALDGEL